MFKFPTVAFTLYLGEEITALNGRRIFIYYIMSKVYFIYYITMAYHLLLMPLEVLFTCITRDPYIAVKAELN